MKFGSKYLIDRLSEGDEIWHIGSSGLAVYSIAGIGEFWARRSPLGRQNTEGCKNCNAFLQHRLAYRDEIWHNEGGGS